MLNLKVENSIFKSGLESNNKFGLCYWIVRKRKHEEKINLAMWGCQ